MAFRMDQRVKVRTGEQGVIIGQPDSDPIVLLDGQEHGELFYRSEVSEVDPATDIASRALGALEGITDGPWCADESIDNRGDASVNYESATRGRCPLFVCPDCGVLGEARVVDAEFIAAAPELVRELLGVVTAMQQLATNLRTENSGLAMVHADTVSDNIRAIIQNSAYLYTAIGTCVCGHGQVDHSPILGCCWNDGDTRTCSCDQFRPT